MPHLGCLNLCCDQLGLRSLWVQVTVVMKFGGSSVATAERMREVLDIICTFPEHLPCVVLSAMGKVTVAVLQSSVLIRVILALLHPHTDKAGVQTTNLLLQAGQEAQACSPRKVDRLEPLMYVCARPV